MSAEQIQHILRLLDDLRASLGNLRTELRDDHKALAERLDKSTERLEQKIKDDTEENKKAHKDFYTMIGDLRNTDRDHDVALAEHDLKLKLLEKSPRTPTSTMRKIAHMNGNTKWIVGGAVAVAAIIGWVVLVLGTPEKINFKADKGGVEFQKQGAAEGVLPTPQK